MTGTDDSSLHAAVMLLGTMQGRALLGCDWGTRIGLPDDRAVCPHQAVQIIILYDNGRPYDVKVCQAHADEVLAHTAPHASE